MSLTTTILTPGLEVAVREFTDQSFYSRRTSLAGLSSRSAMNFACRK